VAPAKPLVKSAKSGKPAGRHSVANSTANSPVNSTAHSIAQGGDKMPVGAAFEESFRQVWGSLGVGGGSGRTGGKASL
jgi:hypothetical protein